MWENQTNLWGGGVDSPKPIEEKKQSKNRRITHMEERSTKHIYKRAHSEIALLNCLDDEKLKEGNTYNFITSGDVDS